MHGDIAAFHLLQCSYIRLAGGRLLSGSQGMKGQCPNGEEHRGAEAPQVQFLKCFMLYSEDPVCNPHSSSTKSQVVKFAFVTPPTSVILRYAYGYSECFGTKYAGATMNEVQGSPAVSWGEEHQKQNTASQQHQYLARVSPKASCCHQGVVCGRWLFSAH